MIFVIFLLRFKEIFKKLLVMTQAEISLAGIYITSKRKNKNNTFVARYFLFALVHEI